MALKTMAAIVVRPRGALWFGATLVAAGAMAGCGHSRTSYRPVYTSPATVSTPCKNCGSGATVTTEESDLPPVTSVVSPSEPSMFDPARPRAPRRVRAQAVSAARPSSPRPSRDSASRASMKRALPETIKPLRRRPQNQLERGRHVQGPTTSLSPSSTGGLDSDAQNQTASTGSKSRSAHQSERTPQAVSG